MPPTEPSLSWNAALRQAARPRNRTPSGARRREADRLGVDELRPSMSCGAHPEAGVHQVGERARIAKVVGHVVHEGGVLHVVAVCRSIRSRGSGNPRFVRQAAAVGDFLGPCGDCRYCRSRPRTASRRPSSVGRAPGADRRMGEADGVVGQLQVGEQVQLAAAPDGAVAVLVAGEIREDRHQRLAVRVGRIGMGKW
jgi:hypothetical protein